MKILHLLAVIATIGSFCSTLLASSQLTCTSSQLSDIVSRISRARFEKRNTKPKLARCKLFVELIRGQSELSELLAIGNGEQREIMDKIDEILKMRSSCPGLPMGGLGPLQEFIEECQELMGLASCGGQTSVVVEPAGELVGLREANAKLLAKLSNLEQVQNTNKINELIMDSDSLKRVVAEQKLTMEKLDETKNELERTLVDEQKSSQHEKIINQKLNDELKQFKTKEEELKVKIKNLEETNTKLSSELSAKTKQTNTALQLVPGSEREIEIIKGENGKMGIVWSKFLYGSVFVAQVIAGSPAARAGLRFGDQNIQIDGRPTSGMDISQLTTGNRLKFLVRKSPMELTYVIEQVDPTCGLCFIWSRRELVVQEVMKGGPAARAGILVGHRLIAVNGESVLGLDGAIMTDVNWWPKGKFTLTFMPQEFFSKLTRDLDLDILREENNKIRAEEKAGRL